MTAFLLLHGFAQTPASWDEVARQLQALGHHTYVPDLYECKGDLKLFDAGLDAGLDAELDAGLDAEPDAEAALASVRSLGASPIIGRSGCDPLGSLAAVCERVSAIVRLVAQADEAPVLVGYSMGGRIAAETLVRHPDLPLAGLVLESAGLGPADETTRCALAERNAAWAARLREEGVAAFMDWWEDLPLFASQRSLSPETRAALRAERTARDAEPLARSLEAWGAHCQSAEEDTVAALVDLANRRIPVVYLAGALDEKYAVVAAHVRAAASCDRPATSCDRDATSCDRDAASCQRLASSGDRDAAGCQRRASSGDRDAASHDCGAASHGCGVGDAGLRAVLVPDAGHNVHLECATAFVEILKDVLA